MESDKTKINYVIGYVFSSDLKSVWMVVKDRPDWMKGLYNGIGGKCHHNEPILTSMSREFLEETGSLIKEEVWDWYATMEHDTYVLHYFTCVKDFSQETMPKTMETEQITMVDIDYMDYVPTVNNVSYMLRLALDYVKTEPCDRFFREIKCSSAAMRNLHAIDDVIFREKNELY